jgi:prepilin signal peptidase PulO-like enzyme (type II secretory pathway)
MTSFLMLPQSKAAVSLAALYAVSLALSGLDGWQVWVALALMPPLLWVSVVDLFEQVIPDTAVVVIGGIGLAMMVALKSSDALPTVLLAVFVLVGLGLASELYWRRYQTEALGLGDVKLLAAGTLVIGAEAFWIMLLLAALGGSIAAFLARRAAKTGVPFGPFLAYAIFITFLIAGPPP